MKDVSKIKYKAIDFFCGGGGMTCGLRQAGIDVIAGVDLDENAKETYEYNNPGSVFVRRDVKRLHSNYFEKNFEVQKNDDRLIMVGCSPKEILWLNDVFDIHRNEKTIRLIKEKADGYDLQLKSKADSLMQNK